MKPEEFNKQLKDFEEKDGRRISKVNFDAHLKRRQMYSWIAVGFAVIAGISIGLEWPGRWFSRFGEYSSFVGWGIIIVLFLSLIKDFIKKDGAFYILEE
jgi:hypothetical protein